MKICCDILNGTSLAVNWSIFSVINNIVTCSGQFGRCDFVWARREANEAAHALAKYAASPRTSYLCCNSNIGIC